MSYKSFDPPLAQENAPEEVAAAPTKPARRRKRRKGDYDNRRDVRIKIVLRGKKESRKIHKAKCRVVPNRAKQSARRAA